MRIFAVPVLMLSLSSLPGVALAAGHMKAGLWEMTMKSDALKNMPKPSPEQIAQMRKMGINLPQLKDRAMVLKICVSPAMAEHDGPPIVTEKEAGCERKNYQHSGSNYSLDLVCNGELKGTGKAKGTFSGGSSFVSTYDFKGTMRGRPVTQHHETNGKWLGADCGNVKLIR